MNAAPISPAELQALLTQGCTLVDVREGVEHAEGHLAGAISIPLGEIQQRVGEIDRSQPVVVMCRGGMRGAKAAAELEVLGLAGSRNLEGGLLAWQAAGLPVTGAKRRGSLPLMQQVQVVIGCGVLVGVILSRLVHLNFIWLSGFFGAGLIFAGSTGWCGLAMLMAKMPWNRVAGQTCGTSGRRGQ